MVFHADFSKALKILDKIRLFLCGDSGRKLFKGRRGAVNQSAYQKMLQVAIEQAEKSLAEGGIPIGAALFDADENLLGKGHNRRIQDDDPSMHGETNAFRNAGRQKSYRKTTLATTLAPCWYCCGLIRQFKIGRVLIGESVNFEAGNDWLRECGVEVIDLHDEQCISMLGDWIDRNPEVWNEDIGEG